MSDWVLLSHHLHLHKSLIPNIKKGAAGGWVVEEKLKVNTNINLLRSLVNEAQVTLGIG